MEQLKTFANRKHCEYRAAVGFAATGSDAVKPRAADRGSVPTGIPSIVASSGAGRKGASDRIWQACGIWVRRYACHEGHDISLAVWPIMFSVVRYVERNALRANLAARTEEWPWSSLRRGEREDPSFPILSPWPLPRPTDWLEIVNRPQSEVELNALRRSVRRGSPFGSADWIAKTAKQLGIEPTVRTLGRPRKERSNGQ